MLLIILLFHGLAILGRSQTTYTGCHTHASIEYCYGPDGQETPLDTYYAVTSTTRSASTLPAPISASVTTTGQTTVVTDCHAHETQTFCINGNDEEVQILAEATATGELPARFTGCHAHGDEQYCLGPDGSEVLVVFEGITATGEEEDDDDDDDQDNDDNSEGDSEGIYCHFHAGVEHCVAAGGSESSSSETELSCDVTPRDYNIPLRIGTLFVVLVTSGIGVFAPMILTNLPSQSMNALAFTVVKQFGTGVIISTVFVHLLTHASLMFNNECLDGIDYEGTTSAIVMAGIILAFFFEYIGHRIIIARGRGNSAKSMPGCEDGSSSTERANTEGKDLTHRDRGDSAPAYASHNLANLGHSHGDAHDPANPNSKLSVMVMEAGILFHSILIGLTLVVAGDSFYKTLLVVITFHQFFEGLALGARIALLPSKFARLWPTRTVMGIAFMLVTPIGMAIGIGIIHHFNGNDKSTIVAIGTLDALSAGILIWVGVVDMLARDWIWEGGEMRDPPLTSMAFGIFSLFAGMIIMSVLGKWA